MYQHPSYLRELIQLRAELRTTPAEVNRPTGHCAPLVDQVRDYLATLPDAQKGRISLPMLLPHLQGKYREQPHLLHVARAMRQIGYTPVRSWKKADAGARYWIAPESK